MNHIDFEQDVIDDIANGKKISAIKRIRASHGIGLKEAKELVDKYCLENKIVISPNKTKGSGGLVLFILLAGLAYSLYKSFS